jgi:hypothetical protein
MAVELIAMNRDQLAAATRFLEAFAIEDVRDLQPILDVEVFLQPLPTLFRPLEVAIEAFRCDLK